MVVANVEAIKGLLEPIRAARPELRWDALPGVFVDPKWLQIGELLNQGRELLDASDALPAVARAIICLEIMHLVARAVAYMAMALTDDESAQSALCEEITARMCNTAFVTLAAQQAAEHGGLN